MTPLLCLSLGITVVLSGLLLDRSEHGEPASLFFAQFRQLKTKVMCGASDGELALRSETKKGHLTFFPRHSPAQADRQ